MATFEAPQQATFYTNQDLQEHSAPPNQDRVRTRNDLEQFLRSFSHGDTFPYRDQLRRNLAKKEDKYSINVDINDLAAFDEGLAAQLRDAPRDTLPLFEEAARTFFYTFIAAEDPDVLRDLSQKPEIQLQVSTNETPFNLRDLVATHVSKLVTVSGIIISASAVQCKATKVVVKCPTCDDVQSIPVRPGLERIMMPRYCPAPRGTEAGCSMDPYVVDPELCKYNDLQNLKLQEAPEDVPTGELPRYIRLTADRSLVSSVVPGTRVTVTGIYAIEGGRSGGRGVALQQPYLQVVGIGFEDEAIGSGAAKEFSMEEQEQFQALSRNTNLHTMIQQSIAPAIYGSEDIKKAIACALFGGSAKRLADGMRLRGDINVLMLGDPSTAKSQLLKFAEKVAPISVYTSGKGSSAAGLTASVVSGPNREFYLEGGAMVMADGGVVCIDEFDKMRAQDRVAIHEAMEQQTISIAKAGISTVLNSRTAVIAAANPKFGSFDDQKDANENIDFQSTILSRFDTIFLVRDTRDAVRDALLSKHVMNMHARAAIPTEKVKGPIDVPELKRYIAYARSTCKPRLSPAAALRLRDHYVEIRQRIVGAGREDDGGGPAPAIPITVRQLEAIIRLSESLAKMILAEEVRDEHVDEAIRLFEVSTLAAAKHGVMAGEGFMDAETREEIQRCEEQILRRMPRGERYSEAKLESAMTQQGRTEFVIRKAISALVGRGELQYVNQRRHLIRGS